LDKREDDSTAPPAFDLPSPLSCFLLISILCCQPSEEIVSFSTVFDPWVVGCVIDMSKRIEAPPAGGADANLQRGRAPPCELVVEDARGVIEKPCWPTAEEKVGKPIGDIALPDIEVARRGKEGKKKKKPPAIEDPPALARWL
jgi:hypothetical protein